MSYISVVKFSKHQHYKNRKPPWVKFYVSLLDPHHPVNQLPVPTRYLFDRLLLLAAEYNNAIPNDFELIAKVLRMPPGACREGLAELEKGRWIKVTATKRRASKAASKIAPPEKEIEKEIDPPLTPPANGPPKRGNGWVENLNSYTGCRVVRGEGGVSHVYDPLGTESLPSNWPYERPTRQEIATALQERAS